MGKSLKGITLIEILVSSMLLLCILGLLHEVLVPSQRFWLLADARAQAQLNAQVGFRKIMKDLQASSINSVTVINNPPALSFVSGRKSDGKLVIDTAGKLIWQKYLVYYRYNNDLLLKEAVVSGKVPSPTPTPLTATELLNLCDGNNSRKIAMDISNVSFQLQSAIYAVDVSLTTTTTALSKLNSCTIRKLITLNN